METFDIPRRRVTEYLGIAKSTLYRWLHKIKEQQQSHTPVNKTPAEIATLVWEITKANVNWGRVRIANQMALLNIFIAASTIRNILNQPKPRKTPESSAKPKNTEDEQARSVPAWYPNRVWSIDTTMLYCWGLWPIHICVIIDHCSRKVIATVPLEGPNAGWINNALESAIEKYGPPKHIISDQAHVFTGEVFAKLLDKYDIKLRFGAVGKHESIAVTERVNKTLKPCGYNAYFYRTQSAATAEIDLVLTKGLKVEIAIEIKYSLTSKLTRSSINAINEVNPLRTWVIYPDKESYPIKKDVWALSVNQVSKIFE